MRVTVDINIYEVDGKEIPAVPLQILHMESHWNRGEFVVIYLGAKTYTVAASDLEAACGRCRKAIGES